ncbi:hypothetical protein CsSME_00021133 [Camellia sinensis var. sinensis]
MSNSFAAIVGGVVGALAVLAIAIGIACYCISQCRNLSNRNSDTGSSEPPATVERKRGGVPSSSTATPPVPGPHGATQFTMEELEQATNLFHESNLIGYGSFGLVYKGLLRDGNFVAIKRRSGVPRQELVEEYNETKYFKFHPRTRRLLIRDLAPQPTCTPRLLSGKWISNIKERTRQQNWTSSKGYP